MQTSPEEHLAWLLEQIPHTARVRVRLDQAHGRVLAEDVRAAHPLPLWDNSAMDGYAVRSADTAAASERHPVDLQVLGEVPAGSCWDPPLASGQAVRIMTGAPVPSAADAIVRVEATIGDNGPGSWAESSVRLTAAVPAGREVRRRGEDLDAGALVAREGDELGAVRLSALAAAGVQQVEVRAAPRVAVLVTGSELLEPGTRLERGQIPESNSLLIGGLLAEAGLGEVSIRRSADTVPAVQELLAELGASHDVIVSTGGVGPGTRDVMRLALESEAGVRQVRVAVRPGQPQCAGPLASGAFVFALPGNPVSAAVSFELFVRPCLRAMQGHASAARPRLRATAAEGWRGVTGRWQVLPVVFDQGEELSCAPAVSASRISHSVGGFGAAEGYALVEPERGDIAAGDDVSVIRLQA